jgi:hypothetical protein
LSGDKAKRGSVNGNFGCFGVTKDLIEKGPRLPSTDRSGAADRSLGSHLMHTQRPGINLLFDTCMSLSLCWTPPLLHAIVPAAFVTSIS